MSAARRAALRALLRAAGVDALLVTDLVNVRYLTGFTGSNAALLVHVDGDDAQPPVHRRPLPAQAAAEVPDLEVVIERAVRRDPRRAGRRAGVGALGFEADHVTVDAHAALAEDRRRRPWCARRGLVEQLRMVKDDAEIAALRKACAVADPALAELIDDGGLRPGRPSARSRCDLEDRMRALGADGPVVRDDRRGRAEHRHPAPPPDRPGCAAATSSSSTSARRRRLPLRHDPHRRARRRRRTGSGRSTSWSPPRRRRAGPRWRRAPTCADVDAAARDVIADAGHGEQFAHGLGHGVGLEIHEAPLWARSARVRLAAGMPVTVEPGVYLRARRRPHRGHPRRPDGEPSPPGPRIC